MLHDDESQKNHHKSSEHLFSDEIGIQTKNVAKGQGLQMYQSTKIYSRLNILLVNKPGDATLRYTSLVVFLTPHRCRGRKWAASPALVGEPRAKVAPAKSFSGFCCCNCSPSPTKPSRKAPPLPPELFFESLIWTPMSSTYHN